jgi:hypothetical protein
MKKKITMIDSSAFSLWNSKSDPVDVRDYGDYLLRNRHLFDHCVNLDVIPGIPKSRPTEAEADAAAEQGYRNLKYLESIGLDPVPVYHQGEDERWLKQFIDDGYDYIGISPDNSVSQRDRISWLAEVFYIITDRNGLPIFKAHGFGVTDTEILWQFPWYSCDSTTWKIKAGYGGVLLPMWNLRLEKFDYSVAPATVAVSCKSPKRFTGINEVYNSEDMIAVYSAFFEAEGISYDEIASDAPGGYEARCRINLRVMQRTAQHLPVNPHPTPMVLPDKIRKDGGLRLGPRKLIFATTPGRFEDDLLTDESVFSRLLSYKDLRDKDEHFLEHYMFEW